YRQCHCAPCCHADDREHPQQRQARGQDPRACRAEALGRAERDLGQLRVLRLRRRLVHHGPGAARRRWNGDLMTNATNPFQRSAREVIIAEAARTPMGRSHAERGWFRNTHPNEMLGAVYTDLIRRSGLAPAAVEDLIVGCTAPFGEQSRNIGRNAWLQAGYPPEVPAVVLDRRCGSAQTAVEMGAALVGSGTHDLVIAGGVEHMGHVPINSPAKISELYGDPWPAELREKYDFVHQGESAELIADRWGIARQEMDEFAV